MAVQSFARDELCRRRLVASSLPISAHHVTPVSMVLPSLAHSSPLQQMRQVTRESHHHRLPEFFRVVREGRGVAVRAEKSTPTSAWNEEQNNTPGPSDNGSAADRKLGL
ncbi:hypothetical protein H2248_000608 [Termitomyces sp. 'cryptogamus']|nr:hypothetical protein H2248_000608 [Termitomyces sp. 'cryptogamus']